MEVKIFHFYTRTIFLKLFIPRLLPFLEIEKQGKECLKVVDKVMYEIIDTKMRAKDQVREREDILDFFFSATDENGERLTREYLRDGEFC